MARSARATKLETRSSRLKLPVAKKPVFAKIGPSIELGYRRNQTAGTWVERVADCKGGNWTKAVDAADDFDNSDGNAVLDCIGHRGEPQAQLVGAHRLGRGAVGIKVELAFLDAVFHPRAQ
jgi:hypothetical protein